MAARGRKTHRVNIYSMHNRYVRTVSLAEAKKLFSPDPASGLPSGHFEANCDYKSQGIRWLKCKYPMSEPHKSPTAFTVGEMQAIAGLHGKSRTADLHEREKLEMARMDKPTEDFIELAQDKFHLWPLIGDTKAVRVAPRT